MRLVRERCTVWTKDWTINDGRRRGKSTNKFAKEVGKTENGEQEDEKRFSGGGWHGTGRGRCRGKTSKSGKSGGGERSCICRWRSAGDFSEESPQPAEEGEDAEDGAKGGAEVGELFGYGDHCYGRWLVSCPRTDHGEELTKET